ncbi:MAG: YeeE/YedE family protein [Syntrophobacteraceae bacterium]
MKKSSESTAAKTMNPYLAGFLLGLTLLASFLFLGAGLGASGGLARMAAQIEGTLAPSHTLATEYFGSWGSSPLHYYLAYMLLGTFLGGLLSALRSNRIQPQLERGRSASAGLRAALALCGGIIVGFASRLAQGCTSGQALTGGAMLLTGSLLFMVTVFLGGYGAAYFVRRQWND